jgi:LacI family transcriptional regulator
MSTRAPGHRSTGTAAADVRRAPTIVDVAAAAKVSKTTVSRVLNGEPRVAEDTREQVLRAMADLGFQVNQGARSLRTRSTGLVGVLVPVISVFGRIVEELDAELATVGQAMLLTASRRRQPDRDITSVELLVARGVDALLIAPSDDHDPALLQALQAIRTPIVLLDREVPGLAADALTVDQEPGIAEALRYLAASGRRRVGLLTRDDRTRPAREIQASYRRQRDALGLEAEAGLIAEFDDLDRRTARDGVDKLLAAGADSILSTGTMEHTATVLERLTELHISVPRDVGLVVYGYLGGTMTPWTGLPTVAYPVDAIAHAAFQLLRGRLDGVGGPPRVEVVPNRFVVPPGDGPAD